MNKDDKIFVAGHGGMVGSAIVRRLQAEGYRNLVVRNRKELDLTDQVAVRTFFQTERPTVVVDAAAKVGGILANSTAPADFMHDNLVIQTNVIHESYKSGVRKLLFLGSSCIYPRDSPQPIREDALLTGPLEASNEAYALAKIAGVKMCQAYRRQYGFRAISAMPTNLYGPGDNYNLQNSHVLPALLRKFHEAATANAREVLVWGSGRPRREFLHVDDLAEACLLLLNSYDEERPINVGTGQDLSIAELASLMANITRFRGTITFDASKPDGTPRKLLDVSRLQALGWEAKIPLETGVRKTYEAYRKSQVML